MKKVVIAGATGYVGNPLARRLAADGHRVVGLARNARPRFESGLEWRPCDLFSLIECERALEGADTAYYLVHSMLPSAHLTQGAFEDMDLVLADNFARAAARGGVRQIVYLGALAPGSAEPSRHIRSRLEVERTLGARGVPVVSLRSGIVVGRGSASFHMLEALARRLPVIPCPPWTRSRVQAIAVSDVLELLRWCLGHPAAESRVFDIGSPDVLSYREILERIASALGVERRFVDIPVPIPGVCGRLLTWVSGLPATLVAPLLESTRHDLVARDRRLQERAGVPGLGFDEAVRLSLSVEPPPPPLLPPADSGNVRSVQRMGLPPGATARWAAARYAEWVPGVFRTLLQAEADERRIRFLLRRPRRCLLELTFSEERSPGDDRQLYYITGGLLSRPAGGELRRPRLEFREMLGRACLVVAIHDYRPTLPWPLYNATQARVHLWVMRRFAEELAAADPSSP